MSVGVVDKVMQMTGHCRGHKGGGQSFMVLWVYLFHFFRTSSLTPPVLLPTPSLVKAKPESQYGNAQAR